MFRYLFLLLTISFSALCAQTDSHTTPVTKDPDIQEHEVQRLSAFQLETPPITPEEQNENFYKEFVHMLWSLGLLLIVLMLIMIGVRKMFSAKLDQVNAANKFKIVEKRTLNTKTTLYCVEFLGKGVIFAESSNGVTRLAEMVLNREDSHKTDLTSLPR